MTMGHYVLMGRKTYDTLEEGIPGRRTIIISRKKDFSACDDCILAGSIKEGIEVARQGGETELFIAGGGTIYSQALEFADRMYLTEIDEIFEGNTYFPEFEDRNWVKSNLSIHPANEINKYPFSINEYNRTGHISSP